MGLARVAVALVIVAQKQKSKVGEMASLPAKELILASVGEALVFASPFGRGLVKVAQTESLALLDGSGPRQANRQRRVQAGDGLAERIRQSDVQNGTSKLLVGRSAWSGAEVSDG